MTEDSPTQAPARRALLSAGALVTGASVAVNALAYVVPVLAARLVPVDELGALGALLAIGATFSVVGTGLQTAVAVHGARGGHTTGAGRISACTALATAGLLVAATPVLAATLDLPAVQALLVAAMILPVVLAGRWLGELQGGQRFRRFAAGVVLLGLARYGGVLAGLVIGSGVTGALALGAGGAWLAVAALVVLAGRPTAAPARDNPATGDPATGDPAAGNPAADSAPVPTGAIGWRAVLRASAASVAMLAISSADVVLAQAVLPKTESGAYVVGSVLTKGVLWAPGVLTVLALPAFARRRRYAVRLTAAGVIASGVAFVTAAAVAGNLAVRLAGGARYTHLADVAAGFALVGGLYALTFVVVNAEIALGLRWPAATLWGGLLAIACATALLRPSTLDGLLAVSAATAAITTIATGFRYALARRRHEATARHRASAATAAASTQPSATA